LLASIYDAHARKRRAKKKEKKKKKKKAKCFLETKFRLSGVTTVCIKALLPRVYMWREWIKNE
jgi:hypothetical protein